MFNSTILDVAVGLIFGFLAVSLVASAMLEAISSAMKWRSTNLLAGVKQLVNDPGFTGMALQLYQHAAINPRGVLTSTSLTDDRNAVDLSKSPAYIGPQQFATAIMDILKLSDGGLSADPDATSPVAALQAAVDTGLLRQNPQLHTLVSGIVQRSKGNLADIEAALGDWFDNGMDRLSGDYKRRAQLVSFLIALALAVLLNVDAIRIAHILWNQPTLADNLKLPPDVASKLAAEGGLSTPTSVEAGSPATAAHPAGSGNPAAAAEPFPVDAAWASGALAVLDRNLPVGWPSDDRLLPRTPSQWVSAVLGWLIVATATLFGAPFWFDVLQGVVRLKGTGPSPRDKAGDRPTAV